MRITRPWRRPGPALLSLLALVLAAPAASAEPHSGVDVQLYRPAFDPNGVFSLEGATILPRRDFSMKLGFGFGQAPFQVPVPGIGEDDSADRVLKFNMGVHLTLAFALTGNLQLGLDTGLYRTTTDEGYGTRGRPTIGTRSTGLISLRAPSNLDPSVGPEGLSGPYDVRVGLKYQLSRGRLSTALLATTHLPFGNDEMFLGDANLVFEPRLAVDYKLNTTGSSRLVANAAVRVRERTVLEAYDPRTSDPDDAQVVLDVGTEALVGAGVVIEAMSKLTLGAEAVAFVPLPASMSYGACRRADNSRCATLGDDDYFQDGGYGDFTVYAMGGLTYRTSVDTMLSLQGGAGAIGARREDFRVMTGFTWAPSPAGTRVVGRGDRDGDGIPDHLDLCPDEPEDFDGFQDEDGCPELDNDGDGILDADDECPNDPEDRDGFEDADGCPDPDNDGDGIMDVIDRCPNEPEDFDGFQDEDGCPDEDNDGDGVPDYLDLCPNEAGPADNDGCPVTRQVTGPIESVDGINMQGTRIEFEGRTANLSRGSRDLLDIIGEIITNRNLSIRVEVHVALSTRSGNRRVITRAEAADRKLSQARAEAIVQYLVGKGVPIAQLQAAGVGSTLPIDQPRHNPINERVDFIKIQQ